MSSNWLQRACPNCGGNVLRNRPVIQAESPAETMSFDQVQRFFVGLRKGQVFFSYYRCKECSLLYAPYYFFQSQLEKLYEMMPENLMGEDKSTVSKTQTGYASWLSRRVKRIESFMELGPDIGLFGAALKNVYEIDNALMIEPNKNVHQQLLASLESIKNVYINPDIGSVTTNTEIDLIVGIHVFDHLLEPVKVLKDLKLRCEVDSKLLIVVHNERSILRSILSSRWPPFCLQHPQLFNPGTLRRMLSSAGWTMDDYSKSTNWWHLKHLASLGSVVFGVPTSWTTHLPNIQIPIKLGNVISIASGHDRI